MISTPINIEKEIQEIVDVIISQGFEIKEGSASVEELLYLSRVAEQYNARIIGETGFHIGLSSLAFLQTHPEIKATSFDIGEYQYVPLAKKIIDQKFPGRHTLIYGDSRKTVPEYAKKNPNTKFDLIFIDGGHDYKIAKADILNMKALAGPQTVILIDDLTPWLSWGKGPTQAWTEAIQNGLIVQGELYKDGKPVKTIEPPGERSWALGRYIL